MAFPYVSASEDENLENLLVSGFAEACVDELGIGNVAFIGSCSMDDKSRVESAALHSVQDYLTKRMEESHRGKTDLVVFYNGGSRPLNIVDRTQSEHEVLSELICSVEESGAKYSVLYVSDPSRSMWYPSYRELQRFLAESTTGNESTNSTVCDAVCQIKSSLLEGVLVVKTHLEKNGIEIRDYTAVSSDVALLATGQLDVVSTVKGALAEVTKEAQKTPSETNKRVNGKHQAEENSNDVIWAEHCIQN